MNSARTIIAVCVLATGALFAFAGCASQPKESEEDLLRAKWRYARTQMGEIHKALNLHAVNYDGEYPESLEEIADSMPGEEVPTDPFTREAFFYELTETGFLLGCWGSDNAEGGDDVPELDIYYDERGLWDE